MPEGLEFDAANGRQHAMWEEGGLQLRSNLVLEAGKGVPLHAHHFDHLSIVTHGWFLLREIAPDGTERTYQMASKGFVPKRTDIEFRPHAYRLLNRAWYRHEFTLLECQGQPGEVLCIIAMENMK